MYTILLQAQGSQSMIPTLLMIGGLIVVFYFFMLRPQQKKAKDQKKFSDELKKGDDVVTIGGVHGRIIELEKETVVLEIERGGRVRVSRSAVSMDSTKQLKGKST